MNVYVGGRGFGKTTRMIEEVKKNNGILVVHTGLYAKQITEYFGLRKDQVMCFREIMNGRLRGDHRQLYVDDAGVILGRLLGNVGTISVTGAAKTLKPTCLQYERLLKMYASTLMPDNTGETGEWNDN